MDLHAGLSPKRVCITGLFLWCLLFDAVGVHAEGGCKELPVFSPSPLVVKHGDPAIATCSICNSSCDYELRVEEPYQATVNKGNQVLWNVPNITDWTFQIYCYIFDSSDCITTLDVIVYQPPERVSMSFRNHSQRLLENPSEPLEEGLLYCLQCEVEAVAPAQNMTVAFYRGLTELSVMRSSTTHKSPVNVNLCLNYSVSRQDHGATFWCEARLELGLEGPQPPLVVRSPNITANVHYAPWGEGNKEQQMITVTQGQSVELVCSSEGNPQPLYSWSHPSVSDFRGDVLSIPSASSQHEGPYTCTASNALGAITRSFILRVHNVPVTTTVAPYVTTTTTAAQKVPIMTTPPPHVSTMTTATPYVNMTTAATPVDSITPSPKSCAGQLSFLHHSLYTSIFVWVCWGLVSLL